jgi:diguanylate cyclase (GGDEF)-like protein
MDAGGARVVKWCFVGALACICGVAMADAGAPPMKDVTRYIDELDRLKLADHARFATQLAQLHAAAPALTAGDRWRVRYLDAWEAQFIGHYPEAEHIYRDIIDHSGDPVQTAKATGSLLHQLALNRRYEEALTLAEQAGPLLAALKDRGGRLSLLGNLSQSLNLAGQTDLAIRYARMMQEDLPPGETRCLPLALEMFARDQARTLRSDDPALAHTIDACSVADKPVYVNAMWLTKAERLVDERQPLKALAIFRAREASVAQVQYFQAQAQLLRMRAMANDQLRRDSEARRDALAAVAMFKPGEMDEVLRDAYQVLYNVAKRAGDADAALTYFQQYATQDRAYLDNASARAMAYEAVHQRTLVASLEAEKLARQNHVLQLERGLGAKALEAGRLSIALLVCVLGVLALWLVRTRRSQSRFRYLSRHDSLTSILNHQHFMMEAGRTLHELASRDAEASLVLLDLDHFKAVNDTHGHMVGDVVLQRAVDTCKAQIRPTDLFGRLGGEEFGILLIDCLPDRASAIAERIRAAIETTPVDVDGQHVVYTTSVGVASTVGTGHDMHALRRAADAALYRAKRAGRNRVETDQPAD